MICEIHSRYRYRYGDTCIDRVRGLTAPYLSLSVSIYLYLYPCPNLYLDADIWMGGSLFIYLAASLHQTARDLGEATAEHASKLNEVQTALSKHLMVSVNISIYISIYTFIHTYLCLYLYMHTHIHKKMHACTCM